MNCVSKFDEGFGVFVDVLSCLFLEELDVEVCEVLVHVLAARVGEVLAIDEAGFELGELHQAEAEGGVAQV